MTNNPSPNSEGEEAAARQRQREEEALARRKAAKEAAAKEASAAPTRAPERATESPAPPTESRGPPRLSLAPKGDAPKLTWREREALKKAGQAPPPTVNPTPDAPPADERVVSAEVDLPRRTEGKSGYVPPHLRSGDDAAAAPGGGWRSRETSRRGESPAQGAGGRYQAPSRAGDAAPERKGGYVPPSLREREGARDESPATGAGEEKREGTERKTGGYVPPHLRGRRE